MSKQLYEEALADVRATREAITADAKRALVEALAPRIQNLVEKALMNDLSEDSTEDEEIIVDDGTTEVEDALAGNAASSDMSTADIMSTNPPVPAPSFDEEAFESRLAKVESEASELKGASKKLRENRAFPNVLSRTISELDDMYGYVQESVSDPERKAAYEGRLEATFGTLTQIQETVNEMSKQTINEEDLTLKLTNLPDEIDLDNVGIDLITDDEAEGEDDAAADAASGAEGDELDLDFGGGDDDLDDVSMGESAEMDDDTVVEIDENMLRAEITRLKGGLTESEHPASVIDDFGNGKAEGDPLLDADIDDTNEVGEAVPSTVHEAKDVKAAKALVQRRTARILKLRKHLKEAREKGNKRFEKVVRKELGRTHQRLVEAQARLKNVVGETSPKNAVTENRTVQRPADNAEVQKLRKKLEEKNLYTAKLVACNKLLQNDGLTAKQKAQVIARLDEAKTPREAKLIYDSIARVFSKRGNVNEGTARTTGSSSRVTRSASTLNEQTGAAAGADVERWQVLAGLK